MDVEWGQEDQHANRFFFFFWLSMHIKLKKTSKGIKVIFYVLIMCKSYATKVMGCDCNDFYTIKGGKCKFKIQDEVSVFSKDLRGSQCNFL